jgi:hypothetical protein
MRLAQQRDQCLASSTLMGYPFLLAVRRAAHGEQKAGKALLAAFERLVALADRGLRGRPPRAALMPAPGLCR